MWRKFWDEISRFFLRPSNLGTPENPEIIEPGSRPRTALRRSGRASTLLSLLKTLVVVSVPAALMLWLSTSLVHAGLNGGGFLPWLLLLFCLPPTAILSLIAFVVDAFVLFSLIGLLSGKQNVNVRFSSWPPRPGARPRSNRTLDEK